MSPKPSSNQRVLVADDNEEQRSLISAFLGMAGLKVDLCEDGLQAIAQFDARRHQLVVLDLEMPGCTGLEVIEMLRIRGEQVPIILTSGHFGEGTLAPCRASGRVKCVPKPFTIEEFQRAVQGDEA